MTTTALPHPLTLDPLHTGGEDDTPAPEGWGPPMTAEEYLALAKDMFDDECSKPTAPYMQGLAQIMYAVQLHDVDGADGRWATECVDRLEARILSALAKMRAAAPIMDEGYFTHR